MLIKPKKSLGQNFLKDKNIINIIIEKGNIKKKDNILEIGPGTGNLTEKILSKKPKNIFVIEKDTFLSKSLNNKFENEIKVINEDILNIDESKIFDEPMTVFGNLPYNISTQILVKWIRLKSLNQTFEKFILMFQKEVAERIIASTNNKNYGRISILASWRLDIKKIIDVSPGCFYPVPKVMSTVLLIKPKKEYFKIKNIKNLEHITNIFFSRRRKMIKKPLNLLFKNVNEISKKLKINLNDRPQNLSPMQYFQICAEYEKLTF
tara:strand:- start:410 stop:1201 length:792 start_codon:yes stop_codon:yes gene_type:complete